MKSTKLQNIGKKFHKLTILKFITPKRVLCDCECGIQTVRSYYEILRGKQTSCGCWKASKEYKELLTKRLKELQTAGKLRKISQPARPFNPFKFLLNHASNNPQHKIQTTDLDADYLKQVWENQKGLCNYSGIPLKLPISWSEGFKDCKLWESVSIDRIDSKLGYVRGNVQLVSRSLNYAKNIMSDDEMKEFLQTLSKYLVDRAGNAPAL